VELIEEGAVIERIAADRLTSQRLTALLARPLADDVKALLTSVKTEILKAEGAVAKIATLDTRLHEVEIDVARTRENLVAIGKVSAPESAKKLGERLIALEDSMVALRKEREATAQMASTIRRQLALPKTAVSAR
jgi:hypothetical protein